jgi:hypothetical protein
MRYVVRWIPYKSSHRRSASRAGLSISREQDVDLAVVFFVVNLIFEFKQRGSSGSRKP